MGFSEKYSFGNLYKIYIMLLHPLFQLKYRLDPQLPRFYRFLILFTRVMIIFCICFFSLRKHPNLDLLVDDEDYPARVVLVIIYIFVCSLIFIPLPDFVYWFFTAKYLLVTPKEVNSEDSEKDDAGPNKP